MSRFREALTLRRWNSPGRLRAACLIVPLAFGLYSLLLGQDRNWDLLNYHVYNGFAAWHGKWATDFAPAGMQTFFNPALDVFYHALSISLPAPAVGFLLGFLHGLNFILVLAIGRRVLGDLPADDRWRLPLLLAGAGVLTANFLSCLGNTMGDNLTALFCLAGLLATLIAIERMHDGRRAAWPLLWLGGLSVGLGTALKLTNGIYAFALCAMLLLCSPVIRQRLGASFGFGVGVLIGFAIAGGYWHLLMWQTWGNPFFPQFSSLFPNPLIPPVGVVDTYWLPKSLTEYLLWPVLFSLDSGRVGQMPVRQIIWAVAYGVFLGWVVTAALRRAGGKGEHPRRLSPPALALVTFVALAYLFWMLLFSIYRYLVPIELLLPIFILVVMRGLFNAATARRWSLGLLSVCTLVVVAGGAATWGHEGWATPPYRAELPPLDQPERTTVVIPVPDPPLAWMAALFPPSVAFTQIEPILPRTEEYPRRVHALIRERAGPVFALFDARHNSRIEQVARFQRVASLLRLDRSAKACDRLTRIAERFRLRAVVEPLAASPTGPACQLALRPQDRRDLAAENLARSREIATGLARHGLQLDVEKCTTRPAFVGDGERPYQWCPLEPRS